MNGCVHDRSGSGLSRCGQDGGGLTESGWCVVASRRYLTEIRGLIGRRRSCLMLSRRGLRSSCVIGCSGGCLRQGRLVRHGAVIIPGSVGCHSNSGGVSQHRGHGVCREAGRGWGGGASCRGDTVSPLRRGRGRGAGCHDDTRVLLPLFGQSEGGGHGPVQGAEQVVGAERGQGGGGVAAAGRLSLPLQLLQCKRQLTARGGTAAHGMRNNYGAWQGTNTTHRAGVWQEREGLNPNTTPNP